MKSKKSNPLSKVGKYIYQGLMWNIYYWSLPKPKVKSSLEPQIDTIAADLKNAGYNLLNFEVDEKEFSNYLSQARYSNFVNYFGGGSGAGFMRKAVQHFVAAQLLKLSCPDVYIDVASFDSPVSEIYQRLYECKTYNQDLMFPEGLHGTTIGGDACRMPVADGFASKMALHCSLEHFEKDSDIKFFAEAKRVLKDGGKLCVVPLYLFQSFAVLTNPLYAKRDTPFDPDAVKYCSKDYYNRHGRFYDVAHLTSRIKNNTDLKMTVYLVNCNIPLHSERFFVALFEKEQKPQ